jgi:general secretion pathway protein G
MERYMPSGNAMIVERAAVMPAMVADSHAPSSSKKRGYTLIELMIVMAIISILVSIAVPLYQKALIRTKESLLKNNLFTLRTVIDEYTFDKKKAPQTLQDLVSDGYLRAVPIDPITGNDQSWVTIMEDSITLVDQTQPGIWDVHSGSDLKSLEGTPYSSW